MTLKLPWFQLVTGAVTGAGLFGLIWYQGLSREDKASADALTAEVAQRLYGRAASELTVGERASVNALVRANLVN
jgi:hypothetical protein